jgi:hypothetical protein
MNMTVYVVHEVVDAIRGAPVYDTTAAEEFGERRVLVRTTGRSSLITNRKGFVERRARMLNDDASFLDEAVDAIRNGLAGYTSDDYLVPIGAPKLIAAASAVAAHRSGGYLKLLLWNVMEGCYDPVVLDGLWSEGIGEKEDATVSTED